MTVETLCYIAMIIMTTICGLSIGAGGYFVVGRVCSSSNTDKGRGGGRVGQLFRTLARLSDGARVAASSATKADFGRRLGVGSRSLVGQLGLGDGRGGIDLKRQAGTTRGGLAGATGATRTRHESTMIDVQRLRGGLTDNGARLNGRGCHTALQPLVTCVVMCNWRAVKTLKLRQDVVRRDPVHH